MKSSISSPTVRITRAAGLTAALTVAVMQAALAQSAPASSAVSVDWSALEGLGSAPATAAPTVVLHAPPKPPVVAARASPPPVAPPVPEPALASVAPAPTPAPPVIAAPTPPVVVAPAQPKVAAPAPAAAPVAPKVALAVTPPPPPPAPVAQGQVTMVRYVKDESDIPAAGQGALDAVAAQLAADAKLRLQLVAYAGGGSDAVEERRLALARAIKMRSYLIAKGVQSIRMDVRAFDSRNAGTGPADRVDLVIVDH